jgi:uncharacterized protein with PIN domain
MLHGLSEQIVHCHFRAAECRSLAARSVSASDRELYVEREQAWLALARSYEVSERLGRVIKEVQRRAWGWPAAQIATLPSCPTCHIEMRLLAEQPTLIRPSTIFERAFFQCPNCGRLSGYRAALPRD